MKEIVGMYQDGMKHADTHIHTTGSDGLLTPQYLVELAVHHPFGIDAIVVTDHNTIAQAVEAQEYALQRGYPLEVVVGEEVSATVEERREKREVQREVHLLALYIESPISRGLSVEDTIRLVHRAGGFVIAPHPFYRLLSLGEQAVQATINNLDEEIYFDGFEVFNFGITSHRGMLANEKAKEFYDANASKLGAPIAATDAHFHVIGGGVTGYVGNTLREGIQTGSTVALGVEDSERQMLRHFAVQFFGMEEVLNPQNRRRSHERFIERRRR